MPARLAITLLVLQCLGICVPIRVPTVWDGDNSEVQPEEDKFSVEQFKPQVVQQQPIPIQYFEYTAKKPQFAVDVAAFHGVQTPEKLFKARPVTPINGRIKPELGRHRIQDEDRPVFHQFQKYINQNDNLGSYVTPATSVYNVFHPYKAEEPRLQEIYKDPVLDKIRNDIRVSSQRLEKQQNDDGKSNVSKDEYLESLDQTDSKKAPQKNEPVPYEIHRPQRRPVYYRPIPKHPNRDQVLNQRFKHPWNQNYVKIRPLHYQPLKHQLQRLRQHHALTYDDERNQYPQVPILQPYEEPSNGYDIYVKGKEKYVNLRNNLDESINNLVTKNRPIVTQKLELQEDEKSSDEEEEEEFVPVKNYAQVRKTETTKHLPKEAAFDDAESYEEIKNAPRLREAIKSTKAQTVYTEEGYEDSAYDHAGEQKHASDHEAHGGFLKENELSGGKYKAPSVSASYEDAGGLAHKDQVLDGKIWNENNKDSKQQEHSEDYSEDDYEHSAETENYKNRPLNNEKIQRNKRHDNNESESEEHETSQESNEYFNTSANNTNATEQHDVNKRETDFKVPEVDIDSTLLTSKDILEIAKEKIVTPDLSEKYPYYLKNLKSVNINSPIRYAENFKLIPRKTQGGTEFYDSRSQLECPEVDEKVDALPEKLKKRGHPDESETGDEKKQKGEQIESLPRLEGLGDKIDCFKAKYFGHNPLDSPFFNEDIISEPQPVYLPNLSSFKLKDSKRVPLLETASNNIVATLENLPSGDIYALLEKLKKDNNQLKDSLNTSQQEIAEKLNRSHIPLINIFEVPHKNNSNNSLNLNTLEKSMKYLHVTPQNQETNETSKIMQNNKVGDLFETAKHIYNTTTASRKKRAAPFVYEPYKIIRDVQPSDSKKTTTTGNISPLIKQLQSSRVIDTVVKSKENDKDQPLKVSLGTRTYKDIGKKEREKPSNTNLNDSSSASIVDVSVDKRRGEPRYEIRPLNHKAEYSPVQNKKAMSIEDYETQTKLSNENETINNLNTKRPSARSLFNIANNFQKSEDFHNLAASNTVRRTITTSPRTVKNKKVIPSQETKVEVESDEDYEDEYDDEDEEDEEISTTSTTTTTTTTPKPIFRKRMRIATTTQSPVIETTEEPTKLKLVTRFRNSGASYRNTNENSTAKYPKLHDEYDDATFPKYREKKKMSSKSTLVTDTKKYGDEDDDMKKEEIDALIGVKHNMDDYMPLYEKEALKKNQESKSDSSEQDESEEIDDGSEEDDEDEDDDESDEDEEDEEDDEEIDETQQVETPKPFTTESPKRSLVRTTDAPLSTTEAKSAKLESKPLVSRRKVAIHKELPVDKKSPHVTEFKQDIEEVEIIKEIPRKTVEKKPNKNSEALNLYKDDNLATDINKLGAVEVFNRNLDLKNGPKHGGNYRKAPELVEKELSESSDANVKKPKDAEASQTENKKSIELDDSPTPRKMHGGNLKSINDAKRSRGEKKFEKYVELKDITEKPDSSLHGGNLKSINDRSRQRGGHRSEKLIELEDDHDDDDDSTNRMHGGNFKPYSSSNSRNSGRGLHGGNYRSSRLIQADNNSDESTKRLEKAKTETTKKLNSADLLNSFARAVPILTTTPSYILDPSKRMYYYVDA
ncbi:unnamed protein product [Chilo suppressalis]|uniref:Uncharacterized protein n=1 Tax=Chilo suppressalis TaxID=168631 RepID=A0ABN8BGH9_CHISP|nr:unnamed protein product [Chilo suppressalis]